MNIKVKKLNENAKIPTKGSEYSAGWDLYACINEPIIVKSGKTVKISTGLAFEIPIGYAGFIYARSGLATKHGINLANSVACCDCDYRGDYTVPLHNNSSIDYTINPYDRIAQVVFMPYFTNDIIETNELTDTKRGVKGFGSSGR
ncbi:Deoxyuridine 5'-triphosphate nucleotidohydrolase [Ruminococcaceae bacterium BL-6]|nr:Deoxyuridine 5'-triphosphate nucleotidohydrolase [Ruminococcaceae bacterium BL-6]